MSSKKDEINAFLREFPAHPFPARPDCTVGAYLIGDRVGRDADGNWFECASFDLAAHGITKRCDVDVQLIELHFDPTDTVAAMEFICFELNAHLEGIDHAHAQAALAG